MKRRRNQAFVLNLYLPYYKNLKLFFIELVMLHSTILFIEYDYENDKNHGEISILVKVQ